MIIMSTDEPESFETVVIKKEREGSIPSDAGSIDDTQGHDYRSSSLNGYVDVKTQYQRRKSLPTMAPVETFEDCQWINTKRRLIDDEPSAKRKCLSNNVPINYMRSGDDCTNVHGNHLGNHRLGEQSRNRASSHRENNSPPAILNDRIDILKKYGPIEHESRTTYANELHTLDRDKPLGPASIPPKKRHSDGFDPNGVSFKARLLNRSCSDISCLNKVPDECEANVLQQTLLEMLYKKCCHLTGMGVQQTFVNQRRTPHQENPNHVPTNREPSCGEVTPHSDHPKPSETAFGQRGIIRSGSNTKPLSSPQSSPHNVFETSSGHKSCQLTTYSVGSVVSDPPDINLMMTSPGKVSTKSSSPSLSVSPQAWTYESPNSWQQKQTEEDTNGSPLTHTDELVDLQARYRRSPHPTYHWAEKEFSVKELRHLIPLLILELFDLKSDPVTKKVKGIWDKAPVGWPSNLPYIDPNNGQKPTGKPKKDVLLKMFNYLLQQYIAKLDSGVTNESPRKDTAQKYVTPAKPKSKYLMTNHSFSVASDGSVKQRLDTTFVHHTSVSSSSNVAVNLSQSMATNITTTNRNTKSLPKMPPLIPITEMVLPEIDHQNNNKMAAEKAEAYIEEEGHVQTFWRSSKMSSKPVEQHNAPIQEDMDPIETNVHSPEQRVSPPESTSAVAPEQCGLSSPVLYPPSPENVCAKDSSHCLLDSGKELNTNTETKTKTNTGHISSPFRGMKARILGSCMNTDLLSPKTTCDTACSAKIDVNSNCESVDDVRHQGIDQNTDNKCTTCINQNENSPKDTQERSVKSAVVAGSQPAGCGDVINSCRPDVGGFFPVVGLYSRIKEKVYYLHWTGWLTDEVVKLLYGVLEQLKSMKQVTVDSDRVEELYIEVSHTFESILDVVILRKTVRNAQITIVRQLKEQICGSIYSVHV